MIAFKILNRFKEDFFELVYPRKEQCVFCDKSLGLYEDLWCEKCLGEVCSRNEKSFFCDNHKAPFVLAKAVGGYHGLNKDVLQRFKYQGERSLAVPMGKLMALEALRFSEYLECDFICYVPMTAGKLKKRGYNQAELLASEVGRWLRLPVQDVLEKKYETPDMAKLNRQQRVNNLIGVFDIKGKIFGKRVVLVDDVLTTGSTATACSGLLLDQGIEKIHILTFASGRDWIV